MRRPIAWIGGALLLSVVVVIDLLQPKSGASPTVEQETSRDRMRVTIAIVGPETFGLSLDVTGLLAARNEVSIGAAVAGQRIAAVLVDVGDIVTAGQLLARLETDTLTAQARQAEAAVARTRAAVAQAEAANAEAQANLRRGEALVGSSGAVSGQQADERRAAALNAAAAVVAARAELAGAEAQFAQSRAELARTEIRAPGDGVISGRTARVGALADRAEPLFRLIRDGEVELLAEAPERSLPLLEAGQRVILTVNGVERSVEGRVRVVEPTIDPQSRLGIARIAAPVAADLRSGAFARGRVMLGDRSFEVAAPESALRQRAGGRAWVMVVDHTGKVASRPVRTGRSQAGKIEILSGLQPGERVVQTAGAFLRDGDVIEPVPARITPAGGAR